MGTKRNLMENNSSKDIAVFTFARGSQIHTYISESESYQFVSGNFMTTKRNYDKRTTSSEFRQFIQAKISA
jgi:hypothetical protein